MPPEVLRPRLPGPTQMSTQPALTPEILVPRLGETLVRMGLLEEAQLRRVLNYQHARAAEGQSLLFGEAVIELGLLDRATLDRAVTEQIVALRQALEDANRGLEQRVEQRTFELEHALRRLSELNQLKADFISNVSHELRAPLAGLLGYLDLLTAGELGNLNERQASAIDICRRASDRLKELIDDLLMFSDASGGAPTLQLGLVDLCELAREAITLVGRKAADRGIRLETDLADGVPPVRADGPKIAWVLAQLLDNGIKYTERGGSVTLRVAPPAASAGLVLASVTDTGRGISPDRLEEIFEPFHQLDGSATRRTGGTGLGLAIAREIVRAHGTRLDVRSVVDAGTTFSFTLVSSDVPENMA
jgi:signal transduction histidine kinase